MLRTRDGIEWERRVLEQQAVILISHRLTDVFAVCDRIMALRQGEVIADEPTAETTMNRVVAHIVGADDGANERAGEPPGGGSVKCS